MHNLPIVSQIYNYYYLNLRIKKWEKTYKEFWNIIDFTNLS
jgi:hypothetical protein